MHYVQYLGPSDTLDLSNVLGREAVFHSPNHPSIEQDLRGNILNVTNDQFDELMTFPGHRFREVDEASAKELVAKQTQARKWREERAAQQAAYEAQFAPAVAAPSVADQIAAFPTAVEIAPAAPRPTSEVKAETRAETAALKDTSVASTTPAATK